MSLFICVPFFLCCALLCATYSIVAIITFECRQQGLKHIMHPMRWCGIAWLWWFLHRSAFAFVLAYRHFRVWHSSTIKLSTHKLTHTHAHHHPKQFLDTRNYAEKWFSGMWVLMVCVCVLGSMLAAHHKDFVLFYFATCTRLPCIPCCSCLCGLSPSFFKLGQRVFFSGVYAKR